jgi:phage host-nuclease inhibitor protein Gam
MKYATFNDIAYALGIVAKNMAIIKKKEAMLNGKIAELNQKFEIDTAEPKKENDILISEIESFCVKNKNNFEAQRTMQFATGSLGFRNNPPKIGQLNRKYTVASSIELIKKIFKGLYLRTKEEIDKDAILSAYASKEVNDQKLAAVGLKIDQGETFFIKPDWEKLVEEKYSQVVK